MHAEIPDRVTRPTKKPNKQQPTYHEATVASQPRLRRFRRSVRRLFRLIFGMLAGKSRRLLCFQLFPPRPLCRFLLNETVLAKSAGLGVRLHEFGAIGTLLLALCD